MSPRRVVAAVAAAVLLVGFVVAWDFVLPKLRARRSDANVLFLGKEETLDAFRIRRGGESFGVRLDAEGGWTLEAEGRDPIEADVRAAAVVVSALRGTRATSDVDDAGHLDLAPYGLAPPRATLSWTRPGGRQWSVALGSPALAGQAHALVDGRVVLVPERLLAAADHGIDHFRAKRILDAPEGRVSKIEIVRREDQVPAGSTPRLLLERFVIEGETDDDHAHEWRLVAPLGVPANPLRTASLLSRLAALSALGFGEEQPDDAALAAKGLDRPAALLRLGLDDGRSALLAIGDPSAAGNAWARVDAGPLVEIRADVARDALLADDFWRDSRVVKLPKWHIVQVTLSKGPGGSALKLELARDPDGAWRRVQPSDAPVDAVAADLFLEILADVQCGRFEDELAASEDALRQRWDFDGPGSFDLAVLAILPDGTPRRADVELTPFVHDRTTYFAVRGMDEMGRVEACVTLEKSVDRLLDRARELAATPPSIAPAP